MKLSVVCWLIFGLTVWPVNGQEGTVNVASASKDNATLADPQKKPDRCISCRHYTVCSGPSTGTPDTEIALNGKLTPPNCRFPYVCCGTQPKPGQSYRHKCGVRNVNGVGVASRNISGFAEFGEFPWQGAILRRNTSRFFVSACILISRSYALTAAHPLLPYRRRPRDLSAAFGLWNTRRQGFVPHSSQSLGIASIVFHPDFNNQTLHHDIAIVRFTSALVYAPNVDTVCLPFPNETFAGQNCIATAWGEDIWDDRNSPPMLRKFILGVRSNIQCQEILRRTHLGPNYRLNRCFACAGGARNQDPCKADLGGPLVCYRKGGTYSLAGIASHDVACGQTNVPGIYVRSSCYLSWISNATGLSLGSLLPVVN